MNLSLRKIDETNKEACVALEVTPEQTGLVAPNSRTLAWTDANKACVALGVYQDGAMIGLAMYEPRGNEVFSVHRLMIDRSFQGKGAGHGAMQLVMEELFSLGAETIYLSFRPENEVAKRLFEKLGYVFHIEEPDGEIVYRYGPVRDLVT